MKRNNLDWDIDIFENEQKVKHNDTSFNMNCYRNMCLLMSTYTK